MTQTIALTIDGKPASVPAGSTILEAAESVGISIPTLCHKKGLEPFTSCFLCVVEVEGLKNPVPSCATEARAGMTVRTRTENIMLTRRMCLELLLSDHCGDCVAPCTMRCPAGTPVQQFINAIGSGNDPEAIRIVKQALPIPGSLGRVCPRPCESQCRRLALEEPLAICWLHRYAADTDAATGRVWTPEPGADTGKRVAIVGAGPAGMSAAYFLRILGHAVDVFESQPEPGGMLRWGIPAYRLARETLAGELNAIAQMGVNMRYGQSLGHDFHIASLKEQGFDAVFLALGAPHSSPMKIPGENLEGVLGGVEFLARTARGEKVPIGRNAVVVGGGNTAIDSARTAKRLGAQVTLLYRRTRDEMPALAYEVHEAEREGIAFKFLAAPLEVKRKGNALSVVCQQMRLAEPGPDGRRKPEPVPGQTFEIETDSVIPAIGQRIDAEMLQKEGLELDKWRSRAVVNPDTMQTSIPHVFAGGDLVAGEKDKIAVWAVGSGRLAAIAIDQFLNGKPVKGKPETFQTVMAASPEDVPESRFAGFDKQPRAQMPELPLDERVTCFREVEIGLKPENARAEARRCLACGCGAAEDCKVRGFALEYEVNPDRFTGAARDYSVDTSCPELVFEPGKCVNCGLCARISALYGKQGIFGFVNRGFNTRLKPYAERAAGEQAAKIALECAEACPTGAIISRAELGKRFCSCLADRK